MRKEPEVKQTKAPQTPYPKINAIECKACGRCVDACPKKVLELGTDLNDRGYRYVSYLGSGCVGCASCYYVCPEPHAIEVHLPPRKQSADAAEDSSANE